MNEMKLIALYYYVCERYDKELWAYCQRHSPYQEPEITDSELLTLYLFTMSEANYFKISEVHKYAQQHLLSWFPKLPSYSRFNRRLNRLGEALRMLVSQQMKENLWIKLMDLTLLQTAVDSMPVMLARGQRAKHAKVAREVADYSLCKAKRQWFYGMKLHFLGVLHEGSLPIPADFRLSSASDSDNTIFKDFMAPYYRNITVFADKIYDDRPNVQCLSEHQQVTLLTGQRRRAYQQYLFADQQILNQYVSRKRQPIESFFNWLIENAQIQIASKVRSLEGLMVFIYGRLAAALIKLNPDFN